MQHSLQYGYWLTLLLAVPAAGLVVRLFMIQHDCGHGAFFRSRAANDMIGRMIGVLTLTPYAQWRKAHAIHHATSGNLDRRGIGDVDVLTVREYLALPPWRRLAYRLYRHPLVFFGIGPTYLFVLKHRFPLKLRRGRGEELASVMATNAAVAAAVVLGMALFGVGEFLLVQAPVTVLASSVGVWLFYVQHQFEHTYWRREAEWNFHVAALRGSSHYHLPAVLRWFTANIGLHHVHHLCSRIPNYRLGECLAANPALDGIGRLNFMESLKCVRLTLWDEAQKRLVSFRHLRERRGGTAG
jgi:omega-6 fatty acid desaturase (delta-12 desaturase)